MTSRSAAGAWRRRRGFTLIELMVALAIVGILAAVALPSFMNQVRKGRRAEAVTEIYRVSQAQERVRSNNPTYSNDVSSSSTAALRLLPSAVVVQNYTMANNYYTIGVSNSTARRYTITAAAVVPGAMAADTNCRTLVMDVTDGAITYSSTNAAAQANAAGVNRSCWNR